MNESRGGRREPPALGPRKEEHRIVCPRTGAARCTVALLAFVVAGWMAFDGGRALIVGDYVTPRSGEYAGQLGPWAQVVASVGIEPRSTLMKSIFALYGSIWLLVITAYLRGVGWAGTAMLIAAAGSLWYLPFGTVLSAILIVLLLLSRHSAAGAARS